MQRCTAFICSNEPWRQILMIISPKVTRASDEAEIIHARDSIRPRLGMGKHWDRYSHKNSKRQNNGEQFQPRECSRLVRISRAGL
jgi:hypothetical protein